MPASPWARAALVVVIGAAVLLLIRLHTASGAARDQTDAVRGHALAQAWCSGCHAVEKFAIPLEQGPPAFVAVASMRSTTPLSIRVFLQSSHEPMPNFILKKQDIDDLAAYIISLKL
jgi:mono/diheme cytochrome c family protein